MTIEERFLKWGAFTIALVGSLVFVIIQWNMLDRQDEKAGYNDIINAIIEMKKWAGTEPEIVGQLSRTSVVMDYFDSSFVQAASGSPDSLKALAATVLNRAILFYHLEKIYFLSQKSGISDAQRSGLDHEMRLWLNIDGMREFFDKFVSKNENHTAEFILKVRQLYGSSTNQSELP